MRTMILGTLAAQVCVHENIHVYIYIHTHIHTYTNTYIYMYTCIHMYATKYNSYMLVYVHM